MARFKVTFSVATAALALARSRSLALYCNATTSVTFASLIILHFVCVDDFCARFMAAQIGVSH